MLSFSFSSLGFIFTFSLLKVLQMWHMTTAQFAINKRRKGAAASSYLFFCEHVEIPVGGPKLCSFQQPAKNFHFSLLQGGRSSGNIACHMQL